MTDIPTAPDNKTTLSRLAAMASAIDQARDNTPNNLRAIFNSFYEAAFIETEQDGKLDNSLDEAIAAVLALLPEKHNQQLPGTDSDEQRCRFYRDGGFNFAIDQTRRNLIGEQHG